MKNRTQRGKQRALTLLFLNILVLTVTGSVWAGNSGPKVSLLGMPQISSLAGSGYSNYGFSGDGGPASAAILANPFAVAVDGAGNVYIADSQNFRVRVVNNQKVAITVAGVTIQPGNIMTVAGNGSDGNSGDGGAATDAQIGWLSGIAVDASGNIYLADEEFNYIRKVSTAGTISTFAGSSAHNCDPGFSSSSNGDGGAATSATFQCTFGIATDTAGNVYIADQFSGLIRQVNTLGVINTVAGDKTSEPYCGDLSASGDGGAASAAVFGCPLRVAVDQSGNVYVSDVGAETIRVVNMQGTPITIAGVTIQPGNVDRVAGITNNGGYSGDGGLASNALLGCPYGASVDTRGNIYIDDACNDNIRKVDASGTITTFAGTYDVYDYYGDGGPAINAAFYVPVDVASDSLGNVYIADLINNAIRKISPNGGGSSTDFGSVSLGSNTLQMVQLYMNQAVTISSVQANGDFAVTTPGVPQNRASHANQGGFSIPKGMPAQIAKQMRQIMSHHGSKAMISQNSPDNGCVGTFAQGDICTLYVQFTPTKPGSRWFQLTATDSDSINYQMGLTGTGVGSLTSITPGIINTPAGASALGNLTGVVRDSLGNTFVVDYIQNVVYKLDGQGNVIPVAGVMGEAGYDGDGGVATIAHLNDPLSLSLDSVGNLYIADVNNNVIRKVDTNGIITTVAGNGTAGYSGDGQLATDAELDNPLGVLVDKSGVLYIGDTFNNVVRKVDLSGRISTIAGNGYGAGTGLWGGYSNPSGGYGGDGGAATQAELNGPTGLALDASGNLYIADTWNSAIRKLDGTGTIWLAAGTCGDGCSPGYSGDGGQATLAQLFMPYGVAVDPAGDFYIADTQNGFIRKVDVNGIIVTVAGSGNVYQPNVNRSNWHSRSRSKPMMSDPGNGIGDGGIATRATIYIPVSVAVDNNGNFYLADVAMGDVRVVDVSTSDMNFGSVNPGSTSDPLTATVSNAGNATLNFSLISLSANFGWASDGICNASAPLSSGNSCTLVADFAPTSAGNHSGSISLTDDAFNSPHSVTLEGVGTQPDYSVGANVSSMTITQGQTGTATLTVTPQYGYTGTVQFSCTGLPAYSTCAFSPTSAVITDNNPIPVTLTVTTTGPQVRTSLTAPESRRGQGSGSPMLWFLPTGLAGVVLLGVKDSFRKGGRQMVMRMFFSIALLTGVVLLNACGSDSHSTPVTQVTPAGSYSVTVTTTATGSTGDGQHSAAFTITVVK